MPGQGRERFDTPDYPAKAFPTAPFIGDVDPLAERIVAIAREAAERVGTDTAWALTCLANSVNVRRRETNQRETVS